MRSVPLAVLALVLSASRAFAVPDVQGTVPTPPNAAHIASLVDQYLQLSIGATTSGGWLDADAAGNAANRGQSLIIPPSGPTGPSPGIVTVAPFGSAPQATISFDDGAGHSDTLNTFLTQFHVSYTSNGTTTAFDSFCIDLFHTVTGGQAYAVTLRGDLDSAYGNGARMAYIMEHFGDADLSADPDQAAAVQIALWDLSLGNHDPRFFVQDADGSYSSGDENVFSVTFRTAVPEPSSAAAMAAGLFLLGAWRSARRRRLTLSAPARQAG